MSRPSWAGGCWVPAGTRGSGPGSHPPGPHRGSGLLPGASAFGHYDQNLVLIAQRRPGGGRLWQVRAKRVVLATGAHERPLILANNDRPGIMLAGAARTYVNRYGVAPGKRAVIFTNNDSTDAVADHLKSAGITVAA